MNKISLLFLVFSMLSVSTFAMDEADVPPPPMPDYMKNKEVDRNTASMPAESFNDQSAESVKEEFLQAGEEDLEVAEDEPVATEVVEGPISDVADQNPESSAPKVYEDPAEPAPLEEVSEVEEAEPEFENANITPSQEEKVKNDFQTDVGNEVAEPEPAATNPEELAEVEKTLEKAEQEAEAIAEGVRKPSARRPFKAGLYTFSEKCTMYKQPRSLSEEAGSIPAGRKLWIDPHNDGWLKAYKKSGTVYISSDCLQD